MLCSLGFIRVCSGALQVHWGWWWGVSLRMTGFVWAFETDNQHSCLCTSFCGRVGRCPSELWTDSVTWSRIWTSLEPLFPSAPAAAKTPGKTGTVRPTKKKKKRDGVWVNAMFVLMCNFLELPWLHPLCVSVKCRASCPECLLWASLPAGLLLCSSGCQGAWLCSSNRCLYRENNGRCRKRSIQHWDSRNIQMRWKLLI